MRALTELRRRLAGRVGVIEVLLFLIPPVAGLFLLAGWPLDPVLGISITLVAALAWSRWEFRTRRPRLQRGVAQPTEACVERERVEAAGALADTIEAAAALEERSTAASAQRVQSQGLQSAPPPAAPVLGPPPPAVARRAPAAAAGLDDFDPEAGHQA